MATFLLRQFSSAESLQSVRPQCLAGLLLRYREYFSAQGLDVSRFEGRDSEYEAICRILMAPGANTPPGLIDDLCFVDEMATPDAMDALLDAAKEAGVELDVREESTPADVALQMRLAAPRLLEEKHAEFFLSRRRHTFEYFKARAGVDIAFRAPSPARLRAFEEELGARLDGMRRGRGCDVLLFERLDGVWFLVRRGDACRRGGAIERGAFQSVVARHPGPCDVLKYDWAQGELAISVEGHGGKRLVALYRELFGELLFDDKARFPEGEVKYTLEPLSTMGEESLICSDVEGIDDVTLTEVKVLQGGAHGGAECYRARNVFKSLRARRRELPKGRIVRASFLVRFADAKTPRTVTIRLRNIACYTRDSDAEVVERWLIKRGFAKVWTGSPGASDVHVAPALAGR